MTCSQYLETDSVLIGSVVLLKKGLVSSVEVIIGWYIGRKEKFK
jgi:hypothetical protein